MAHIIKNHNCSEANQLVIYKRGQGFKLGVDENKSSSVAVRVGLKLGSLDYNSQY